MMSLLLQPAPCALLLHARGITPGAHLTNSVHNRRTQPPIAQIGAKDFGDTPLAFSQKLFQDSKQTMSNRGVKEREMLRANTREMQAPKRGKGGKGSKKTPSAGGFGKKAAPALTASQQMDALHVQTVADDGVCLVKGVLDREQAAELHACVADELARAYAALEDEPSSSIPRFNVPVETFDKQRGYLLLPLRDEKSLEDGVAHGTLTRGLRHLLAPGAPLGELFATTCGGDDAELYDVVGLRTEAGAARQPIHSDTPWQKTPALFCAFIALHDVQYEMGSTVFLPGTHKPSSRRKAFDDGQFDGRRDEMLSSSPSRYSMLTAGDAVFFNMNTLHAGTANYPADEGGKQRLLLILTFRNRRAKRALAHAPNLRPAYRNRRITLADMRRELATDAPFAGHHSDGQPFGDGLPDGDGQHAADGLAALEHGGAEEEHGGAEEEHGGAEEEHVEEEALVQSEA